MSWRTRLLGIVFVASATITSPVLADYPEKPVTLICWSSAGSGHDLISREHPVSPDRQTENTQYTAKSAQFRGELNPVCRRR